MKKLFLIFVCCLLITGTAGCKSSGDLARETFAENIAQDYSTYETLVSTDYGGGEGERYSYHEIGYGNEKIVSASVYLEWNNIFSRDFVYSKREFQFPNHELYTPIFENHLFDVHSYDTQDTTSGEPYTGLRIDLVVNRNDLDSLLDKIEEQFIPLVPNTITEDNIRLTIYVTDEENINDNNIIVSYLMKTNNRYQFAENTQYNFIEKLGTISGDGYSTIYDTYFDNVAEQLADSLQDLRIATY